MNFQWLRIYIDKITSLNVFERDKPPNHVLINEYLPAQGIMVCRNYMRLDIVLTRGPTFIYGISRNLNL